MRCGGNNHVLQMMIPNCVADPLAFHFLPPSSQNFTLTHILVTTGLSPKTNRRQELHKIWSGYSWSSGDEYKSKCFGDIHNIFLCNHQINKSTSTQKTHKSSLPSATCWRQTFFHFGHTMSIMYHHQIKISHLWNLSPKGINPLDVNETVFFQPWNKCKSLTPLMIRLLE